MDFASPSLVVTTLLFVAFQDVPADSLDGGELPDDAIHAFPELNADVVQTVPELLHVHSSALVRIERAKRNLASRHPPAWPQKPLSHTGLLETSHLRIPIHITN